ncbi:MAG: anthranilate synthase component I [Actinomycetota bacterium]|nr:anthranilate synthase component I [Actinomycetota bacterium]
MAHRPDRSEFTRLLAEHAIVPVWREVLADALTPVGAFLRLDPRPNGFLLESVEGGERWARYSFIGGDAFGVVTAKDGAVSLQGDAPVAPEDGEPPLAYVGRLLEACRAPAVDGLPPLHGGAVGFLGYDCVRELERLPDAPEDDLGLPDLALLLTRTFVVFDHLMQKAFAITNVMRAPGADPGALYDDAVARCDEVVEAFAAPLASPAAELDFGTPASAESTVDDGAFEAWVETAREHIYAGDVFQVVPSRRFEAPLRGSSFNAYRALRALNPSPYMYFLRFPDFEIAGSSPEPLVRVTGDRIETRPIAGTRGRGATRAEDEELERGLLADAKERAEHVMLVDLARNDVGRVARYGTVEVEELMVVERYSHVMHIVSSVTGMLRPDRTPFDALLACFPAGTVSGAPKVRAMEIIDSLERTRRGPYAGVVGYFDFSGNLDTCITIRTIVATGGRAYVQAGAGIVADSDPASEAEETRRKAEALLRAVVAAERL